MLTLALAALVAFQCPDGSPPPCSRAAAPRALRANGVAMRFLESTSRDSADHDLAEGLTDEIIARLSQEPGLQVSSRYATLRYRGRPADPAQVGRELGVRYVIDGTLRRTTQGVRLVLTMADAPRGFNVWGRTFERRLEDIASVEDSIAQQVGRAVRGEDTAPPRNRPAPRTTNASAYQAYLNGSVAIRSRTAAAATRAIAAYRAAIALDSGFAPAYAGLAHVLSLVRDWGWPVTGIPSDSVQVFARRAALRARALDSTASTTWLAAAMVERVDDLERALSWHRRAVTLDSTNIEAVHQLAWGMLNAGLFDSAMTLEREVIRRDPYYAYAYAGMAQMYLAGGQPQEALTWIVQGLAIDSTLAQLSWLRADASLALGRTGEARAAAARAAELGVSPLPLAVFRALLMAREGDSAGARALLPALRDSVEAPGTAPGGLAMGPAIILSGLYAQLGDVAGALEAAHHLARYPHRYYAVILGRHWYWEPIRSDPRFQAFLAELQR
jgi:TolB-like protein